MTRHQADRVGEGPKGSGALSKGKPLLQGSLLLFCILDKDQTLSKRYNLEARNKEKLSFP